MTHLWEIDHPYYGADGNETKADSFAELKAMVDASDADMNPVYRWDWLDYAQPHHDDLFLDDEDRSKEVFRVYMLMPRKSGFWMVECPIAKAQEQDVLEWLRGPRVLGYLKTLWEPVLDEVPGNVASDREAAIWGHHVMALEQIQQTVTEQVETARRRATVEGGA